MAAGIVELNALPDAVRAATQNHDLLSIGRGRLAALFIARVHVRRETLELRRAGVNAVIDCFDAEFLSARTNVELIYVPGSREAGIGHAIALCTEKLFFRRGAQR